MKAIAARYDGYISIMLLLLTPLAPYPFAWLATTFGIHSNYGLTIGGICCFAFSIGFAISGIRQPQLGSYISGCFTLLVVALYYLLTPVVFE